jgi:Fur family peroxide stress response transcriptional regulator
MISPMDMQQERINNLVTSLREKGYRLTPQRMAVLKIVIGNQEHLSAEEIYARARVDYPMMGLATVYKTIAMLKDMGEIVALNFHNQGSRYDGSGQEPHPHFICNGCHAIIDLDNVPIDDLSVKIAAKTGYHITDYRLDFFGLCPNCQS